MDAWLKLLKANQKPTDPTSISLTALKKAIRERRAVCFGYTPDGFGDGNGSGKLIADFDSWDQKEHPYCAVVSKPLPQDFPELYFYKDDWYEIHFALVFVEVQPKLVKSKRRRN